jgi:hypothetical protein
MTILVTKIITNMYRSIGVINPTAGELDAALNSLNDLLEFWSINDLMVYVNVREALTLVVSQATYTLGTGGDLNSVRPETIVDIFYRDDNDSDTPIRHSTELEYNAIPNKTSEGRPTEWFYAPEYPLGKLYLYPVPNDTNTLQITSKKPFSTVAIGDSLILPNGYNRAIKWNLALEMSPDNDMPADPIIVKHATDSLLDIQGKNAKPLIMRSDSGMTSKDEKNRQYNIYTGE